MINSLDMTSRLAIDTKSIDDLHLLSKQDSKKALQEAAKQFEALFLQMLVKSMRDATLKSGLIDSQQTQFYTEMYDQQLAQSMSAKGIGLADMMVEQLTRTYNNPEQQEPFSNTGKESPPSLNNSAIEPGHYPSGESGYPGRSQGLRQRHPGACLESGLPARLESLSANRPRAD